MSDQDDRDFAGHDDARMSIRAAVRYLLKDVRPGDRGDMLSEIIEIVRQAAHERSPGPADPFDDDAPGG